MAVLRRTSDGRFRVPRRFVEGVGAEPGDAIFVRPGKTSALLSPVEKTSTVRRYTVRDDGAVFVRLDDEFGFTETVNARKKGDSIRLTPA